MTDEDTDDLLTISALAVLFKQDRRTIERRLANVDPVRTVRRGTRIYKFYRRAEVRDLVLAKSDAQSIKAAIDELAAVRASILAGKRALRQREILSADEYQAEVADRLAMMNTRLQALPNKLADRIAGVFARSDSEKARVAAAQDLIKEELDQLSVEMLDSFSWEKE